MSDIERNKEAAEQWLRQFLSEESPWSRLGMLGGVLGRVGLNLVDVGVKQAGVLWDEAQQAFLEAFEGDGIEDAKIIEEIPNETDKKPPSN